MLTVLASIVLFGPSRGGLRQSVKNRMRPSFSYSGQSVACEVLSADGLAMLPLDSRFQAVIKLPYGDKLGWKIPPGTRFELNIASQVIGEGETTSETVLGERVPDL